MKATTLFLFFAFAIFTQVNAQDNPREFTMTEGDTTYVMKKYVMCFLKKGPTRDQGKEEVDEIQKAHLAHINKMAESGVLVVAGPFEDETDFQGILIFDLATIDEAKEWTEQDPAVKAGRLVAEYHPWWGAKGTVLK